MFIEHILDHSSSELCYVLCSFKVPHSHNEDSHLSGEDYTTYLSGLILDNGLQQFLPDTRVFLSDATVLNVDNADWRRLLKEMETKWVSFYGAKADPKEKDKFHLNRDRMFIGTRNLDFIPVKDHPKTGHDYGTTWNMTGERGTHDYVRFFDRNVGAWRSTYKAYMTGKGVVPEDQQIPYDEWLATFGGGVVSDSVVQEDVYAGLKPGDYWVDFIKADADYIYLAGWSEEEIEEYTNDVMVGNILPLFTRAGVFSSIPESEKVGGYAQEFIHNNEEDIFNFLEEIDMSELEDDSYEVVIGWAYAYKLLLHIL